MSICVDDNIIYETGEYGGSTRLENVKRTGEQVTMSSVLNIFRK